MLGCGFMEHAVLELTTTAVECLFGFYVIEPDRVGVCVNEIEAKICMLLHRNNRE